MRQIKATRVLPAQQALRAQLGKLEGRSKTTSDLFAQPARR